MLLMSLSNRSIINNILHMHKRIRLRIELLKSMLSTLTPETNINYDNVTYTTVNISTMLIKHQTELDILQELLDRICIDKVTKDSEIIRVKHDYFRIIKW